MSEPVELLGTLREAQVKDGAARGPWGLRQRRVRPSVFGEAPDSELISESEHPARPHRLAFQAWRRMFEAGREFGLPEEHLVIHSAYRSVALQAQVWAYRLEERRAARELQGLPPLPSRELERQQMKWTAKPGQSAHHTGLALDLGLYVFAKRESVRAAKATPTYAWLAVNAKAFGFYPYLPEPWHWEYNPPGLVAELRRLRGLPLEDPGRPRRAAPTEHAPRI
ncbi:MAG TPA: D-alanyl-D-alanine carboxypeptidase family protein [Myxococcota bacterium]|nr:D-alanyl-D-alanine carboxypeptidase family protein [Myxococcota bacterium]